MITLPRLYPILDAEALAHAGIGVEFAAKTLRDANVAWAQYRDKSASDDVFSRTVSGLRSIFPRTETILVINDRVHLCDGTGADGVHIGQQDMEPGKARQQLGAPSLLGISTHNVTQMCAAVASGVADYVAIGPVFGTQSKRSPDPTVGLDGVRAARALTQLPLVAIGGITAENAALVIEAGADAVAVIAALLPRPGANLAGTVRDFLARLR